LSNAPDRIQGIEKLEYPLIVNSAMTDHIPPNKIRQLNVAKLLAEASAARAMQNPINLRDSQSGGKTSSGMIRWVENDCE
jgi:hypothetical protein